MREVWDVHMIKGKWRFIFVLEHHDSPDNCTNNYGTPSRKFAVLAPPTLSDARWDLVAEKDEGLLMGALRSRSMDSDVRSHACDGSSPYSVYMRRLT